MFLDSRTDLKAGVCIFGADDEVVHLSEDKDQTGFVIILKVETGLVYSWGKTLFGEDAVYMLVPEAWTLWMALEILQD